MMSLAVLGMFLGGIMLIFWGLMQIDKNKNPWRYEDLGNDDFLEAVRSTPTRRLYTCQGCGSGNDTGDSCSYCRRSAR